MKNLSLVLLTIMMAFSSCKSVKDLVVKEEKVEVLNKSIKQTYYVIIGSFKDKSNAEKYMVDLRKKSFAPILLRNSEGQFRISVFSTNSERSARTQIAGIRKNFAEHSDVWLLISTD